MKLQRYVLACIVLAVALSVFAMPASAVTTLKDVQQNGTVLLGEKGLDISNCIGSADFIAYWDSDFDNPPARTIDLSGYVLDNFDITGEAFVFSADGAFWYQYDPIGGRGTSAFKVVRPQGNIRVRNLDLPPADQDITDKNARLGSLIDFKLENTTLQNIQMRNPGTPMDCDIEVINPSLLKYTQLWTPSGLESLVNQPVMTSPYYWSSEDGVESDSAYSWMTDKSDDYTPCNYYYPYGTYIVKVACNQNGLGFVSVPHSVTLFEDVLTLTITEPQVSRGERFSTTISGVPDTYYLLWVKDCSGKMTGYDCDQPPHILPGQEDVIYGKWQGYDFGETKIQCTDCFGCLKTVKDTVPDYPSDYYYYVLVHTDSAGQATVEWQTQTTEPNHPDISTKPGTYIIRAQPWVVDDLCTYDTWKIFAEETVTVIKGEFDLWTVVYNERNNTAFLGETVCIRGINKDSCNTYLFIRGPCQSCSGNNLETMEPVVNGDGSTFITVTVRPDGYWEYIWQTKWSMMDLGQYTIYAASKPNDGPSLEGVPCTDCDSIKASCAAWDKQSFIFLEPTLTADINPKILRIQCCEPIPIVVSGRATGIVSDNLIYDAHHCFGPECQREDGSDTVAFYDPVPIAFWVFGPDKVAGEKYIFNVSLTECPSGVFAIDISKEFNELQLQPGEYKVVVQHPMYNHLLDIIPDTWLNEWYWTYPWWYKFGSAYVYDANRAFVISRSPVQWSKLFQIDGPGRMVGMDAYNELMKGFDDQNIDDKTVVLNFKVESNTALRADFSGSPASGTAPLTVKFTDISSGAPTSWLWNFGDGGVSTDQNPTYVYIEQGSFNVSLTVSNAGGSSTTTKADYVSVTGISPTVTPTIVPPTGNTINLYTGWNFVSTPRTLADGQNTVAPVFSGVDRAGRPIYLFDAGTGMWQAMTNTSVIKPLDGLWIYSVGSKSIPLTFKNDPLATPPTKMVYSGWNAIGFSDVNAAAAKDALQSVSDKWVYAIGFNAAGQSYETSIIKGGSGSHADTNPMYPTKGYWLFMNADGTLAAISA